MNFRILLCTCVAALITVCTSPVHAALNVDCPVRWAFLAKLSGPNLDADLFGVKVRDWKPEYLDELVIRQEECLLRANWPESVKTAERSGGKADAERARVSHFARRDQLLREEALRNRVAASVDESKLTQIELDRQGLPASIEIRHNYTNNKFTHRCDTLRRGIGFATTESYRQAVVFARLCQEAKKTDASVLAMLERQAANIESLHRAIEVFAGSVSDEEKRQPPAGDRVRELTTARNRLLAQFKALELVGTPDKFDDAQNRLAAMQAKLSAMACDSMYLQAGMPKAWRANFILLGQGGVERFQPIICDAINSGAQVRYISSGLMSGEGFEIKSAKRTVQIFVESNRVPGGDPSVQLMNPVNAKIDGKKMPLGGQGIYALIAELAAVVQNK